MKKGVIFLTVILLLLACHKTDDSILNSAEFKDVVGVWKPYNNPYVELKITETGFVNVLANAERSMRFDVHEINYHEYGVDTFNIRLVEKDTKKKAGHAVSIFKKKGVDTAMIFLSTDLDSNGVLPIDYKVYQTFVRQK